MRRTRLATLCAAVLILAGCSVTRFNVEQYQSDLDLLEEGLWVTAYYSDGEVDAGVLVVHTPNFLTLVTDAGKEKTVNVSELTFIKYESFFQFLGKAAKVVGIVSLITSAVLLLLLSLLVAGGGIGCIGC